MLGRNGVGKSTLLATIAGQTRRHAGEIRLGGVDIVGKDSASRAWLGLGYVPQERGIFPSLTVEENLFVGLKDRQRSAVDEAYAMFPRLKERRRNRGNQLSGGEQQMLSTARTILGRPSVLMLDEPLEGLAPVICDELMAALVRLASGGEMTILLVEQRIQSRTGLRRSGAHPRARPGRLDRDASGTARQPTDHREATRRCRDAAFGRISNSRKSLQRFSVRNCVETKNNSRKSVQRFSVRNCAKTKSNSRKRAGRSCASGVVAGRLADRLQQDGEGRRRGGVGAHRQADRSLGLLGVDRQGDEGAAGDFVGDDAGRDDPDGVALRAGRRGRRNPRRSRSRSPAPSCRW